ncbi:MAG: hypothetical protein HRU14_15675 [Planctomycetes bacterium]|nr:hypothetical protein [Planctomycetota bacterium]
MNTQPQDPQRLRALELAIQARREDLPEQDQRFLVGYFSAHPDVAREAREMDALLTRLQTGPLPVRSGFQQEMRTAVAGWVRDEVLARPQSSATEGWLRARWDWLIGRQTSAEGASAPTVFLGRSLAFYLGAASVICAFLLLRGPGGESEARTMDRAHTRPHELVPAKKPAPQPDLRGPRPK